jgi:hypothetical protein
MPDEIVTETSRVKLSGRAEWLMSVAETELGRSQIETCPAPENNLSKKDVVQFLKELMQYMKLFRPAFERVEQMNRSQVYVRGLLGNAARKNVEQMALGLGEKVRSLQYFVGQSQWETEPAIVIHQGLIGESLGEADGVALIDESSAVKQGCESVGVAAQYCGSVGKLRMGKSVCIWDMPVAKATVWSMDSCSCLKTGSMRGTPNGGKRVAYRKICCTKQSQKLGWNC